MSPSRSISASPSLAVSAPINEIPYGLSSERAAPFRPFSSSRKISGSSLMTSTLEDGLVMRGAASRTPVPLAHRFDSGSQAALVAGSGVLVNDLLIGDRIDHAGGLVQCLERSFLVTAFNCLADGLHGSAQARTLRRVMCVAHRRLTCPMAGLFGISHKIPVSWSAAKRTLRVC